MTDPNDSLATDPAALPAPERRRLAVARVRQVGDLRGVARRFGVTPDDLFAWVKDEVEKPLDKDADKAASDWQRRAIQRLRATRDADAVARAFNITRDELLALARADRASVPARAPSTRARLSRATLVAALLMLGVGASFLPFWPIMALWAVIGGFDRAHGFAAIFGLTLLTYPATWVACAVTCAVLWRQSSGAMLQVAAVPLVQTGIGVLAFFLGLAFH